MKLFRWYAISLWYDGFVNDNRYAKRIFEVIELYFELPSKYLTYYIIQKQL